MGQLKCCKKTLLFSSSTEGNGKQFRFLNEKQFLKAFPDHKEELKKYADDNKTDFNEIEDVLQIYNHAVTL